MAKASIDALTSPTLKYLRERWWNEDFTEFLTETLRPRAGHRILDVGCGEGIAEVRIGRLHLSQIRLFGVDLVIERVMVARRETAAHNQRVGFAAADACHLPFGDGTFDSTFCVAVLQHIRDAEQAIAEFARVTMANGRIVAVEPDNSARYSYSSVSSGMRAFDMGARFFSALAEARGEKTDAAVGPKVPMFFAKYGIEPLEVRLFPVSQTRLGSSPDAVWRERTASVTRAVEAATAADVQELGREYLDLLRTFESEAKAAGSKFIEIQNTMLFATVGQKSE